MNKKLIIGGVILLVVVLLGGFFFLSNRNNQADEVEEVAEFEEEYPELDPSEIGLEIIPSSDNRRIKLVLNNASDVESIEFDIIYEADSNVGVEDGGTGRKEEVFFDELEVNGQSPFETKFYDLATCSSGRCVYHTGVELIQVIMKVTKTDGSNYQVSDSLEL